jgi:ABC-type multidrug transport system fused ATPase/permease subunit
MKKQGSINPEKLFAPTTFGGFLWAQTPLLGGYLFWRILSAVVVIPFPLITQRIVDDSIPQEDIRGIGIYTIISLFLLLIHIVAMRIAVAQISRRMQELIREMRARIFHKLQFMHFGFLDSTQLGRMLSKYAFDTSNIEAAAIPIVTSVIPEIVRGGLLIVALAWLDPWLLVFLLGTVPIFAWIRLHFFKPIGTWNHRVRLAREQLTGQANEFISVIKLVRGFGQESTVSGTMEDVSDHYAESRKGQMMINQTLGYVIFSLQTGIGIMAVAFAGWLVIRGSLTLGALMALVSSLPIILSPINIFSQVSLQYFLGKESYLSIKELIDSGYVERWNGSTRLEPLRGEIEFDAVRFRYTAEKPEALRGIDLQIRPGEHVAFVGPSGSGKSSLVNLILGLYAPTGGEIRIDGVPQQEIAIRAFRQQCAIVMQDSVLLSGTILENLRFGRPDAAREEVIDAAKRANAWEFIKTLPDQLETRVGERGVSLSGGQRQRLAIARALLRDPRILILDEATSALDYQSEAIVQEAIDRLAHGRTTITIAHRLSTVRKVDRIVVLEEGQVREIGTYAELSRRSNGYFERLLNAQGDGHEEE